MADPDILRHAVERLLEDVSLTADLVDDAAKVLLDWGVARAETFAQRKDLSPEELGAHLADLRQTLKRVGRKAGQVEPEAQTAQVQALLSEVIPEAQAAQTSTPLPETMPEEKEPEVDAWCANRRDRYHLS
jgi:hypothetical protein